MKRYFIIIIFSALGIIISLTSISFTNKDTQNDQLLKIANEYQNYFRYDDVVNDSSDLKWTIQLCAPAYINDPIIDSLHFSKSNPLVSQHGNKLYKLYVKNLNSYSNPTKKIQPLGQIIVKETWNVRKIRKGRIAKNNRAIKQSKNDGKWYTPTTRSELFIMYKEQKSEKNDEGWVYGIVSLGTNKSKTTILENGKISSCINCHKDTKYDRIFGTK